MPCHLPASSIPRKCQIRRQNVTPTARNTARRNAKLGQTGGQTGFAWPAASPNAAGKRRSLAGRTAGLRSRQIGHDFEVPVKLRDANHHRKIRLKIAKNGFAVVCVGVSRQGYKISDSRRIDACGAGQIDDQPGAFFPHERVKQLAERPFGRFIQISLDLGDRQSIFVAQGYRAFDKLSLAKTAVNRAIELSTVHGLGQALYEAEELFNELQQDEARERCAERIASRSASWSPEVQGIANAIQELRTMVGIEV